MSGRRNAAAVLVAVLMAGALSACAAGRARPGDGAAPLTEGEQTNVDDRPATAAAGERAPEYDPIERVNRPIFWFNDKLDVYALEPVAKGWDKVAPDPVQRSLTNFFTNLRFPIIFINDLLQGKVGASATDVGRFGVNTTIGIAGLFDPATHWGMPQHWEDFGQTLGRWGLGPGPYLVLPLFGPSNARDTGGLVGDYVASVLPFFVNQWILLGRTVTDTVNTRALVLEDVRTAKEASLDYYIFVRNAYLQRRHALVHDSLETPSANDDLYRIDEGAQ